MLIDGEPRQLGLRGILDEWIRFRMNCVKRELSFDLAKKCDKLHLLLGLGEILLDLDKAIKIVRETEKDEMVVPNLMEGFGLDEIQAEYIAEIKLRHLNREYILERIKEIEQLQKDIAELKSIIESERKLKNRIIKQLEEIKEKYAIPRKTKLIFEDAVEEYDEKDFVENYNVKLVLTKEGYFKKITLQSLRGSDEQALKPGDEVTQTEDSDNISELLFISDKQKIYKSKVSEFETKKASQLGDYVPVKLGFDEGERVMAMRALSAYEKDHYFVYIFENGKGVRVPVSSYETKASRKKLINAYSDASPLVGAFYEDAPFELLLVNDAGKAVYISTKLIPEKATRTASGVTLFSLKKGQKIIDVTRTPETKYKNYEKCKKIKIPATGSSIEAK